MPDIKPLVTDLKRVFSLARRKRRENFDFRTWVKSELPMPDGQLDATVQRVAREVSAQIDCTTCGNCCRSLQIAVDNDDIALVPTFILTPLTYLGGVFYALEMVPPLARTLSYWNPMFYLVSAFRYAMLGFSEVPPLRIAAVLLGLALAIFG
ncbi:MAG: ABC transporter permease, partial [Chthonomonadales bacterium]